MCTGGGGGGGGVLTYLSVCSDRGICSTQISRPCYSHTDGHYSNVKMVGRF